MDSDTLALSVLVGAAGLCWWQARAKSQQVASQEHVKNLVQLDKQSMLARTAQRAPPDLDQTIPIDPLIQMAATLAANKDARAFEQMVSGDTSVYSAGESLYNF
jgi:hypothetical protein